MATTTSATASRPPFWRDVRVLAWTFQVAVVAVVVAVAAWLWDNFQVNSDRLNIPSGFDYLRQPSGFPIPGNPDFRQSQPVSDALWQGFLNTLRLAVAGIVVATVVGTLLGIARLSQNFIVRTSSRVYVEFIRNIPLLGLLLLIYLGIVLNVLPPPNSSWTLGPIAVINVRSASVFWYEGSNWKFVVVIAVAAIAWWVVGRLRRRVADETGRPARSGLYGLLAALAVAAVLWVVLGVGATAPRLAGLRVNGGINMTPEYFAAFLALVVYTSSHIAEIVRGSIQAVPKGQGEAANALALSGFQRMWYVILPQSMRIAVPPIGNQYLNLSKNSSLAAIISFPEITKVTQLAISNRSPAIPSYALLLTIYLVISLVLAAVVNLANRRLAIVER